jgi:hypothetical protein
MRSFLMSAALAAAVLAPAAFAGPAAANPVAIAPMSVSPELREEFRDDFGDREIAYLQDLVTRRVSNALVRRGAEISETAPLIIEMSLLDADPSKPTRKQLHDTLGLDYFSSISVGGAEFTAVLRRADGEVVDEVSFRRYAHSLEAISYGGGTWSDVDRAARQFANRVADAYSGHASSASAR